MLSVAQGDLFWDKKLNIADLAWAAPFNRKLVTVEPGFHHVVILHCDKGCEHSLVYFLCLKHYTCGIMVAGELLRMDLDAGRGCVRIRSPLRYVKSGTMLSKLRSLAMEDPYYVYTARVWSCAWVVDVDRWLEAEVSDPREIFSIDAVQIWFPDEPDKAPGGGGDAGGGAGDGGGHKHDKGGKGAKAKGGAKPKAKPKGAPKKASDASEEAKKKSVISKDIEEYAAIMISDESCLNESDLSESKKEQGILEDDEKAVDKMIDKKLKVLEKRSSSTPLPPMELIERHESEMKEMPQHLLCDNFDTHLQHSHTFVSVY